MSLRPTRSIIETAVQSDCDWLWTWSGACFELPTTNFPLYARWAGSWSYFGAEVYGADGWYIGEVSVAGDGPRLITNLYKKSRARAIFVPDADRPQRRLEARTPEPLFIGHERSSFTGNRDTTATGASRARRQLA